MRIQPASLGSGVFTTEVHQRAWPLGTHAYHRTVGIHFGPIYVPQQISNSSHIMRQIFPSLHRSYAKVTEPSLGNSNAHIFSLHLRYGTPLSVWSITCLGSQDLGVSGGDILSPSQQTGKEKGHLLTSKYDFTRQWAGKAGFIKTWV